MGILRSYEKSLYSIPEAVFLKNKEEVAQTVNKIVENIRSVKHKERKMMEAINA